MPVELTCGDRFGRTLTSSRLGRVDLTETAYEARERIPPHYHSSPQVCLVLSGGYEERYGHSALLGEPGAMLVHAAGDVHDNRFSEVGGRCLNVSLTDDLLGPDAPTPGRSRRVAAPWQIFRLLCATREPDDLSPLEVEEIVLGLLEDLATKPGVRAATSPSWLEDVRETVHHSFRQPPSLSDLATAAGVHRVHVSREFRRRFGCTLSQYLRQRRVEVASELLLSSSHSLGAITYAAGFTDQSHFTRVFAEQVGTTPGRFRARFRGDTRGAGRAGGGR